MNLELTPEEQEVEDQVEELRPVSAEKRARVAKILDRARKSQTINRNSSKHESDRQ